MHKQLLLSTAVGLILGTAAFAQSPSGSTSSPTSAQTQTNSSTNSTNAPSTQRAPAAGSSTRSEPSNSAANQSDPSSPGSPSHAQATPPATGPFAGANNASRTIGHAFSGPDQQATSGEQPGGAGAEFRDRKYQLDCAAAGSTKPAEHCAVVVAQRQRVGANQRSAENASNSVN